MSYSIFLDLDLNKKSKEHYFLVGVMLVNFQKHNCLFRSCSQKFWHSFYSKVTSWIIPISYNYLCLVLLFLLRWASHGFASKWDIAIWEGKWGEKSYLCLVHIVWFLGCPKQKITNCGDFCGHGSKTVVWRHTVREF